MPADAYEFRHPLTGHHLVRIRPRESAVALPGEILTVNVDGTPYTGRLLERDGEFVILDLDV